MFDPVGGPLEAFRQYISVPRGFAIGTGDRCCFQLFRNCSNDSSAYVVRVYRAYVNGAHAGVRHLLRVLVKTQVGQTSALNG